MDITERLDARALSQKFNKILQEKGFYPVKESGVTLWAQQLDNLGNNRAAISLEFSNKQQKFATRLYVTDGHFFDALSFRRSFIPPRKILNKLGIKKPVMEQIIGDDWLDIPLKNESTPRLIQEYVDLALYRLNKLTPKALKWLER